MELMVTIPQMLKVAEAAQIFRIGVRTLRDAIQRGILPAYAPNGRTQLLKATEVQAWIETRRYKTHA